MAKDSSKWYSERLGREVQVVRWGETGTPLLLFPTAAGDAEECERFHLISVLAPFLEAGRLKVYALDSVAGQAWLDAETSREEAASIQNRFDSCVYHEVVPAIRTDCRSPQIEILTAGASIGAFNALASICRHPDAFSKALCMSGTYDLAKRFMEGDLSSDMYYSSPLHFLPNLDAGGEHLRALKQRFVLLAHGRGRWEDPDQSWRVANALGAKGVPNRVDEWGKEWDHDWPTWRRMLPQYVEELLTARSS
jgi:esterase/lipase superfamily enzyme